MNEPLPEVEVMPIAEAPAAPSGRQIFLGLFIVGQLAFLILANVLGFLEFARHRGLPPALGARLEQAAPDAKFGAREPAAGHLWKLLETATGLSDTWAQLTGQPQEWVLFAPRVADEVAFPALELHDEPAAGGPWTVARCVQLLAARSPMDAMAWFQLSPSGSKPLLLLSENEPRDIRAYLRIGKFRLRRLESHLLPSLPEKETPEETLAGWRGEIQRHVRRYNALLLAYCKFRLEACEGNLPQQVLLVRRRYRIDDPTDSVASIWTGPTVVPIARWQPHRAWDAEHLPVEWYDPQARRFQPTNK